MPIFKPLPLADLAGDGQDQKVRPMFGFQFRFGQADENASKSYCSSRRFILEYVILYYSQRWRASAMRL